MDAAQVKWWTAHVHIHLLLAARGHPQGDASAVSASRELGRESGREPGL